MTSPATGALHRLGRNAALAVPIILVNAFAVYGQALWATDNLPGPWPVAAAFALALESIGVYLAVEAHAALMAGDAALGRRLASYAVAGLVGALNWLHWSGPGGAPTVPAVVFAGFSAVSPWLWAIRSRSMRRDALRAAGLIDPRSVRFSVARWLLYPRWTFRAYRAAVWAGETDPARAIGLLHQPTPAAAHGTARVEVEVVDAPTQTVPELARAADTPTPVAPDPAPARPAAASRAQSDDDVIRHARQVAAELAAVGKRASYSTVHAGLKARGVRIGGTRMTRVMQAISDPAGAGERDNVSDRTERVA